jgi:two-component system LytT family sensor kinase
VNQRILYIIFTCLVTISSVDLYGQSKTNQDFKSPTEMVDKANKLVVTKPLDAFKLATDAAVISKKNKNKRVEANAYNTLGTLYYNAGEFTKAITYFTRAKNIYATITDEKSEEYSLKYLGKSYEAVNDRANSISNYGSAEQKSNSSYDKADYRIKNSKLKRGQGKSEEAISDLERELKTNTLLDPNQKIDIYLELGDLYIAKNDTVKGVDLINKALIDSKNSRNDSVSVSALNTAWQIYDKNGLKEQNIKTQQSYLDTTATPNAALNRAANYNLGNSYLANDAKEASKFFKKSIDESNQTKATVDQVRAVEKLSEAYEKSGEYSKALEQYKIYVKLVDSIKIRELASQMQNEILSTKYEVQETRIKELELKQIEKEEALTRQQWTIGLLVLGLLLLLALTYFLIKNIREKQRSNMRIRLASLRSEMNPHFIFNSLNSVNGFISQNEEIKANRYLSDFSKLMRTVLNNSNNESITLDEELKSLEIYLSLEHSRFPDKFDYQLNVDAGLDTREIGVPPMLIQPYIENAIWHGLRYMENKGNLDVKLSEVNNALVVTISDDGIGRAKSKALKTEHQKDYKSAGMSKTKERLELLNKLYDKDYEVIVEDLMLNNEAQGTRVTLKLPIDA